MDECSKRVIAGTWKLNCNFVFGSGRTKQNVSHYLYNKKHTKVDISMVGQ